MNETVKATIRRESVRISRFCHVFESEDAICVYHALGISPVYLSRDFKPLLDALRQGDKSVDDDNLYALSPTSREDTDVLLSKLRAKRFAIIDESEDKLQLREIRTKYLGHPSVALMYMLVTDGCNLSCSYCYIKNSMPDSYRTARMSPALAIQAVRFFSRQIQLSGEQNPMVIFYGGEPLLNMPALEATVATIEKLKDTGELPSATKSSVVTNGTLVTADVARFFKDHDIEVVVSMDGPEDLTSTFRLQGREVLHKKLVRGLEVLRNEGVKTGISCTLSDASLERFDTILDWIRSIRATSVGFNLVRPIPPFTISPSYPEKAARALIHGYEVLSALGINEDRMGRKVRAFSEGQPYPYDCAGCGNQIVVTPTGKVGLCAGFLGMGKYFVTDVYDAVFDHRSDPTFALWSGRSPLAIDECADCPAVAMCGGGCPFSTEINTGDLHDIDRVFCAHAKMTLEYLIWSLYTHLVTEGHQDVQPY